MCIIIAHRAGAKPLPEDQLRTAWQNNSDGAGYMFTHNGTLHIRKPFWKLQSLMKAYYKDHKRYGASSPFVLHMRITTHGSNNTLNTHPHSLAAGTVGMAHNGILSHFIPQVKNESDTVFFCRTVLAGRSNRQLMDAKWGKTLEGIIGWGNKLVFLNRQGSMMIVNESQGHWQGDTWFSNTSHQTSLLSYFHDDYEGYDDAKALRSYLKAQSSDADDGVGKWIGDENDEGVETYTDEYGEEHAITIASLKNRIDSYEEITKANGLSITAIEAYAIRWARTSQEPPFNLDALSEEQYDIWCDMVEAVKDDMIHEAGGNRHAQL
jgi:hypothetical protein